MNFSHWKPWVAALGLLLACGVRPALAQTGSDALKDDEIAEPAAPKLKGRPPMDYGSMLSYSVIRPHVATPPAAKGTATATPAKGKAKVKKETGPITQNIGYMETDLLATKGITIKLGGEGAKEACVCFDTDMLRMAAGWTGGFLDVSKTNLGTFKGGSPASVVGKLAFVTHDAPGWSTGDFSDPRTGHQGPLPREMAHYKGLYRNGEKVILSYTVGNANVLELPGTMGSGDTLAFTRTFHIDQSPKPMSLLVFDVDGGIPAQPSAQTRALTNGDHATAAGLVNAPAGATFEEQGSRLVLHLPAFTAPVNFELVLWNGPTKDLPAFPNLLASAVAPEDPTALCNGGPLQWKQKIVTVGQRGPDDAPYVVDTLPLPVVNPWNSWMRPGGMDFFSDGRAAVCTMNGDVWIVSGITDKLDHIVWKRYAAGLYEPLGLKIVEDVVYVLGRDQITCLRDLNHDGEADFYENFNNDRVTSPIYHAFAFDLQTDRVGNFYYVVDGNQVPPSTRDHGDVFKVSPDGMHSELFATGFRAANGLGMTADGQLLSGDNQGHWTPSSRINLVKQDGFYGWAGDPRRSTVAEMDAIEEAEKRRYALGYDLPICWIPYAWDNSSGGQVVAGDKWGPFSGRILHTSYGKCTLFEVMTEIVDGQIQGGVVQFPFKFESGIMRGRVDPVDGQVYLCGLKGWQTASAKDGCLQRVRYTGQPVYMPESLHITDQGIHIGFTCPLDPQTAGDAGSYSVEQYTYHYASQYGSKEYKVSDPTKVGHDSLDVKSAKLSADRKSVFLALPGLKPVMQMEIKMDLMSADGKRIKCAIGNTINKVGVEGGR